MHVRAPARPDREEGGKEEGGWERGQWTILRKKAQPGSLAYSPKIY